MNCTVDMKIAWRFTVDFNKQRHLLYEKIKMDYTIEAFSCSCGHRDLITKYLKQPIKYICPECDNAHFYDANIAWENMDYFLSQNVTLQLSYEYDIDSDEEGVSVQYITWIPHDINFIRKKIIFEKKHIYTLEITVNGDIKKDYELEYNNEIFREMNKRLLEYINTHRSFKIPYPSNDITSLKQITFFLKNKHLKEFGFYNWKSMYGLLNETSESIDIDTALKTISNFRKEKSVRRAVYVNYQNQYVFEPGYIAILTQAIEDPNILVKFLRLDTELLEPFGDVLYLVLRFLKQHYKEKEIFKLFDAVSNTDLLQDAMRMFTYEESIIALNFKRVRCNIRSIHDEFTRCINAREYSELIQYEFTYTKAVLKPCIFMNENYTIELPKSNVELYRWGDQMYNCIAEYENRIKEEKTTLYGFFSGEKLKFIVEIKDRKIVEANRKYNHPLNQGEMDILEMWFRRFFKCNLRGVDLG